MSVPVKVGSEFLVNTQTAGDQTNPKITALSDGGFIVTWQDASGTLGDNSGTSIKAQIYAADGAKVGSEFRVNTQTAGGQKVPAVAALSNGGFVVTWQDASGTLGDNIGSSIKAQVYDADGNMLGSEFLINTQTANNQASPAISGLNNGGFVVTWLDYSGAIPGTEYGASIKSQVFAADGSKVGSEFEISPSLNWLHPQAVTVTNLSNGGFAIAWEADASWDGSPINGIFEAVFAADGSMVRSQRVAEPTAYGHPNVSITGLSDGGFVVAYENRLSGFTVLGETTIEIFDANGNKIGSPTSLGAGLKPAITSLSNGGFLVTWGSNGQMFAADGIRVGPQFPVQSQTIAALSNGDFIVAWTDSSHTLDASGTGINAQIFTLGPPPAPTVVSVTDDVGPQAGALANGGATDDTNLSVRIATGSNFVGDTIQLFDGDKAVGKSIILTTADVTRGYVDIQTGALADGTHAISARVTDVTGDASNPAAPFSVTVDGSPVAVDNATVAVTGIVPEDSNLLKVAVNGRVGPSLAGLTVSVYDGATPVGTTSADGDGHWTLTGVTLTDGLNTLSATVTGAGGAIFSSEVFAVTALTSAAAVSTASDADYIVFNGGTLEIGFGIDMTGSVVIGDGGVELDYGNTTETVVASGGAQKVYYGGVSNNTVVEAGGYQGVYFGTANSTRLSGSQQVLQATANDTTVLDGGTQFVGAGGEAVRSVVHQDGSQYIDGNATAADTIVDGGSQFVSGRADGTVVSGGGSQFVYSAADHTMIGDGGVQLVFGTVTNTIIANGGEQKIYGLGTATGTTVNTAGTQLVWGTAASTTINGGAQFVLGTAANTTIASGAQYVQAGGSAVNTTIGAGGVEYVYAGGTANGVTFAGPYGYFGLDQSSALTGTISGWQANDFIDLGDILFSDSGMTLAYSDNADHSGGVLTISDETHLATLNLLGQYTAADFALSSDGHGGTLITNPSAVQESLLAPALAA